MLYVVRTMKRLHKVKFFDVVFEPTFLLPMSNISTPNNATSSYVCLHFSGLGRKKAGGPAEASGC